MSENPAFFNWSLKKLILTIPDTLEQSKVKILFTFLIFSIVKLLIVIPFAYQNGQAPHLQRAVIMLFIYIGLLKLLLSNKKYVYGIAHIMIGMGLMLVISILFGFAKTINILALQFIFMIILSSFYLLDRRFGILYSILGIAPVIIYMFSADNLRLSSGLPDELGTPAFEITVILNFITIVIAHYLYHQALSRNVEEKESLNKQLEIAVEEANIAAQSKSDFLSTMSHELRTPLNSVIGMAELLSEEPHGSEQEENLKILNFSAASLHTLINDILDFNKIGSEKLYLETVSVNLSTLLNDICSGLRIQAKERGLDLILKVDEGINSNPISTDPTRISQIIYNLAGNAIKFTSEGSVTVELKIISSDAENLTVRFSVTDTGIGISEENQEVIFEPFIQASTSTTRNYGGTGLGLAIVKRLLTLFNSTINLESSKGSGAKFWFDINFKLDSQPIDNNQNDKEFEYDLQGLRVLVVEDNPINSLLLKKIFKKWNNIPDFAKDGYEALEKLNLHNYDLILMDIHMPLLDGYETTRQIRNLPDQLKSGVPIIALTASVSNNLSEKISSAGMDDYLAKPYNSRELYLKLKEIAGKK